MGASLRTGSLSRLGLDSSPSALGPACPLCGHDCWSDSPRLEGPRRGCDDRIVRLRLRDIARRAHKSASRIEIAVTTRRRRQTNSLDPVLDNLLQELKADNLHPRLA